jgi:hypothetical protein
MDSLSFDEIFRHLLEVCREAAHRGDTGPAESLLKACRADAELAAKREARVLKRLQDQRALTAVAHNKAQAVAKLIGKRAAAAPQANAASPQAVVKARRRRDPLDYLQLSSRQARAAGEILEIFESLTRGLSGAIRPITMERVDSSAGPRDPFFAMPDRVARLHKERYLPWAERQKAVVAERRVDGDRVERLTGFRLACAVLIDRASLRDLDRRYGLRNGALAQCFREILDDYAQFS